MVMIEAIVNVVSSIVSIAVAIKKIGGILFELFVFPRISLWLLRVTVIIVFDRCGPRVMVRVRRFTAHHLTAHHRAAHHHAAHHLAAHHFAAHHIRSRIAAMVTHYISHLVVL